MTKPRNFRTFTKTTQKIGLSEGILGLRQLTPANGLVKVEETRKKLKWMKQKENISLSQTRLKRGRRRKEDLKVSKIKKGMLFFFFFFGIRPLRSNRQTYFLPLLLWPVTPILPIRSTSLCTVAHIVLHLIQAFSRTSQGSRRFLWHTTLD